MVKIIESSATAHGIAPPSSAVVPIPAFSCCKTLTTVKSFFPMAPPPPSDPSNLDVIRRQKKSAPFKFLVPLVYAPVLPLIRLSLRHRPVLRDRLFTAVLAGAFAHGCYLVTDGDRSRMQQWITGKTDIYDIESK